VEAQKSVRVKLKKDCAQQHSHDRRAVSIEDLPGQHTNAHRSDSQASSPQCRRTTFRLQKRYSEEKPEVRITANLTKFIRLCFDTCVSPPTKARSIDLQENAATDDAGAKYDSVALLT
jgi:hypothetical protein